MAFKMPSARSNGSGLGRRSGPDLPLRLSYRHDGTDGFGRIEDGRVHVHDGDLFAAPQATGETLALSEAALPCLSSERIGLWNNFAAMAEK